MLKQAASVFIVTDFSNPTANVMWRVSVDAIGNVAIATVRRNYGKNVKIVLEGFEVEDQFIPLAFKS